MCQSSTICISPTRTVAQFIAAACETPLPAAVEEKAKLHVLDTLAAIVSGADLPAGHAGRRYGERLAGPPEALLIASARLVAAEHAALCNAMAAHADETDDSHVGGRFHPGCAVVPAALASAEAFGRSGGALLRAVAAGYDVGARAVRALGFRSAKNPRFSTHTIGGNFGACAAAAALAGLDANGCADALSYAVQQTGGVPYWRRDRDHIEKAFDFGGAGARNGVSAAMMVRAGWTGVSDTLTGEVSYLSAFAQNASPEALTDGLGERFEIMEAAIKKWCVGSPIQAALDAVMVLIEEHGVAAEAIREITITMPDDRLHIVDDRDMPDVCLQHLVAVTLLDRGLSFAAAHERARMDDSAVRALREKMTVVPSAELTQAEPPRQAILEATLQDGRTARHHTKAVHGTPTNPMDARDVAQKARDLLAPSLGHERTEALIGAVLALETVADVRELRPLLAQGM